MGAFLVYLTMRARRRASIAKLTSSAPHLAGLASYKRAGGPSGASGAVGTSGGFSRRPPGSLAPRKPLGLGSADDDDLDAAAVNALLDTSIETNPLFASGASAARTGGSAGAGGRPGTAGGVGRGALVGRGIGAVGLVSKSQAGGLAGSAAAAADSLKSLEPAAAVKRARVRAAEEAAQAGAGNGSSDAEEGDAEGDAAVLSIVTGEVNPLHASASGNAHAASTSAAARRGGGAAAGIARVGFSGRAAAALGSADAPSSQSAALAAAAAGPGAALKALNQGIASRARVTQARGDSDSGSDGGSQSESDSETSAAAGDGSSAEAAEARNKRRLNRLAVNDDEERARARGFPGAAGFKASANPTRSRRHLGISAAEASGLAMHGFTAAAIKAVDKSLAVVGANAAAGGDQTVQPGAVSGVNPIFTP